MVKNKEDNKKESDSSEMNITRRLRMHEYKNDWWTIHRQGEKRKSQERSMRKKDGAMAGSAVDHLGAVKSGATSRYGKGERRDGEKSAVKPGQPQRRVFGYATIWGAKCVRGSAGKVR